MSDEPLRIEDLTVSYRLEDRTENVVVANVSLGLRAGEVVGLVGESGCGKSTLALASIGYRAGNARIAGGSAWFDGTDLLTLRTKGLRRIWGKRIAYIGQSASTSLNPALSVGRQLADVLSHHLDLHGSESATEQARLLDEVGIPDPERALHRYPAQFSGGQQQRIAIAIALATRPEVIILDEPTTGLDVTTQARINAILRRLLGETGAATLYVSHDLALLSTICDRMMVMYAGEVVEEGASGEVVSAPVHPYTRALIAAVPKIDRPAALQGIPGRPPAAVVTDRCAFSARCTYAAEKCLTAHPELAAAGERRVRCVRHAEIEPAEPSSTAPTVASVAAAASGDAPTLLEVAQLGYSYPKALGPALMEVTFKLGGRETIGIVGESGSGKTTLLRAIAGVVAPTEGELRYQDTALPALDGRTRQQLGEIQLVFQNPESSLNPRQTVRNLVKRPLELFRPELSQQETTATIRDLLDAVLLPAGVLDRLPGELSGGQMQRVALARAFAARPRILLCDEVTSALDVSVQATILNLIRDLARDVGTAVVFVSHDLAVVRSVAERVVVMQHGVVREQGAAQDLFSNPSNAYTEELLRSIPVLRDRGERVVAPQGERL
jgi:oligopeptide/dipeptide ABC transporter ATP-binding protein